MSFGFSASDIVGLARIVLRVYYEFRNAPRACDRFRLELYQFQNVLFQVSNLLQSHEHYMSEKDRESLAACTRNCKELIFNDIFGAAGVHISEYVCAGGSVELGYSRIDIPPLIQQRLRPSQGLIFYGWQEKWGQRKFAARIPELQQAISIQVSNLTTFVNLIILSNSKPLMSSQSRLEEGNAQLIRGQARLEAGANRLQKAQHRMEQKLEAILTSQSRFEDPVIAGSLNASSPEGRKTWMNLGRLLRAEGITTSMIRKNTSTLVKAIRSALGEGLSSSNESYHTACESLPDSIQDSHKSNNHRNQSLRQGSSMKGSIALLGSAPPVEGTFSEEFLKRHNRADHPLDQMDNVENGMQSLIVGMDGEDSENEINQVLDNDEIDIE
ncbi:hypothetical protein ACLMJK_007545 [Lecanora helva]